MRGLPLRCSAFVFALFLSVSPLHAQSETATALTPHTDVSAPITEPRGAYWDDAKFMAVWNEAIEEKRKRQYSFALDTFKKANKLSGDGCLKCLEQIYALEAGMGKFKDALATAQHMEALSVTPIMKSTAQMDRGAALWHLGWRSSKARAAHRRA